MKNVIVSYGVNTVFVLHEKATARRGSTCTIMHHEKTVNKKDKHHRYGQIYCKVCKDFIPRHKYAT